MNPKISIIIASYNTEGIIKKALDSVLRQKYNEWECLIIDGGSKDHTVKILEGYRQKDSRFQFVSEKDKGIYDAFNKGWKLAKGEWIYYLGADDTIDANAFKVVFSHSIDNYDIVYGNVTYKTPIGVIEKISNTTIDSIRHRLNCSHQGFIMRKSTIERYGGFDYQNYRICADDHLVVNAYIGGGAIYYVGTNISVFDNSGTSGNYETEFEGFRIRRELKSCNYITNLYILYKNIVILALRKLKYKLMAK